nr:hypothetical protein [Chromobacterium vaccinii]
MDAQQHIHQFLHRQPRTQRRGGVLARDHLLRRPQQPRPLLVQPKVQHRRQQVHQGRAGGGVEHEAAGNDAGPLAVAAEADHAVAAAGEYRLAWRRLPAGLVHQAEALAAADDEQVAGRQRQRLIQARAVKQAAAVGDDAEARRHLVGEVYAPTTRALPAARTERSPPASRAGPW